MTNRIHTEMFYAIFPPHEVLIYATHLIDNHSIACVELVILVSHESGRLLANSPHWPSWCRSDDVTSNTHRSSLPLPFCLFPINGLLSAPHACVLSHSSCVRLDDPVDCSPPASSVHGTLQARTLEEVALPSSRGAT